MKIEQILEDIKTDRVKKVIFDTDTYNELDDQYALAYAFGTERINISAVNAALFHNSRSSGYADGMEKSYHEIHRVLGIVHRSCDTFRGATKPISEMKDFAPVNNPASRNIVKTALESDEIVYLLTTGAATNIASALLMEPDIRERVCVVWLGGNCLEYGELGEFNLVQDYRAGQILLNSGVNLVLLPAFGDPGHGTQMLRIKRSGLEGISGNSDAAVFFRETLPEEFAQESKNSNGEWERTIWDIAAPAVLSIPEAFDFSIISAPVFAENRSYAFDHTRHRIIYMESLSPKKIFEDAFSCISAL